jgi:hypothetical protein
LSARSSWLARALGAVAAVSLLAIPAGGGDEPVTNQRVVQLLLTGTPVDELLGLIGSSPVAFDLSDEMLREMKLAGVPDVVINTMKERQLEQDGPPEEPEEEAGAEEAVTLNVVVALNPDSDAPAVVLFPGVLPEELATQLDLGGSGKPVEITDVAVFLACRTATHVPAQWRSKTPLGRDFVSMPRHKILAFHPGARVATDDDLGQELSDMRTAAGERGETPAILALELPTELQAAVGAGDEHALVLGLAIQAKGRFLRIDSAEVSARVPVEGETRLAGHLVREPFSAGDGPLVEWVEEP